MNIVKNFSKYVGVSFLVASLLSFTVPNAAHAQLADCNHPGCFAGYSTAIVTFCDCSGYYYMAFSPLFLHGSPSAIAGMLAVPPAVGFSNFATSPAQKYIGTYAPGVQACWINTPTGCVPLPTLGVVLEFTGVSEPGPYN
jgi:hypothetical protein